MMYRRDILPPSPPPRKRSLRRKPLLAIVACLVSMGAVYGFISLGRSGRGESLAEALPLHQREAEVEVVRLCRDQIPPLNFNTLRYHELFDDMQDVQEEAARRNGVSDPAHLGDPTQSDELVRVQSCDLYVVDTLYHSKPYLVPEAALMLQMIGERFQELLHEQYPGREYRPIVTSVLRSYDDVSRLRRVNRNATENSCHLYGTTVDISYTRYRLTDATDTVDHNELWLKNLLSQVLYELRYEGLIYVKYERLGCFHLTLRSPQYLGSLPSETRCYGQPCPHKLPKPKRKPRSPNPPSQPNYVEI